MAILLQFDYGKKLGLPGYSSHNFGVSMKAEVSDPEEIPQEAERAYGILQEAVDKQMENPGFVRSQNEKTEIKEPTAWVYYIMREMDGEPRRSFSVGGNS